MTNSVVDVSWSQVPKELKFWTPIGGWENPVYDHEYKVCSCCGKYTVRMHVLVREERSLQVGRYYEYYG